jgi:hypothetical protein
MDITNCEGCNRIPMGGGVIIQIKHLDAHWISVRQEDIMLCLSCAREMSKYMNGRAVPLVREYDESRSL